MFRNGYQRMKLIEISDQLKGFRVKTPSMSEGKKLVYVRHASKSPRINHVYLNRDLPNLPEPSKSEISVLGLDSAFLRSDQSSTNSETANV